MARVTRALALASTLAVLATFGQGIGVLRGGSLGTHFHLAGVSLCLVLAANFFAVVHATQSERLLRRLRAELGATQGPEPGRTRADGGLS